MWQCFVIQDFGIDFLSIMNIQRLFLLFYIKKARLCCYCQCGKSILAVLSEECILRCLGDFNVANP